MKQDDYMNRSAVMKTADRKLQHYICNAAHYLRESQEYMADSKSLDVALEKPDFYRDKIDEWRAMARLYRQLCQAELAAARYLIDDMADLELIDGPDWQTIKNWLVWFGFPAEVR